VRVIVAGGSGFLGRHVVDALLSRGHTALVLSRNPGRASRAGVVLVGCDLASDAPPLPPLAGAEAVVNLVGIKRERGTQTFLAVHVEATRRLIEAARRLGARRFVHVSVVCSRPDGESPYHDTKWRGEGVVRESGLDFTILRPGVIYGPGDDMISHLAQMARVSPLMPVVGDGRSLLQPVDVRDVAEAVAASLERPQSVCRSYDVVGPRRLALADVQRTVAAAAGAGVRIVPTPVALLRPVVRVMSALCRNPLSTPAQLRMLQQGLVGDPVPAARDLGLVPRPFTVERVREVLG
jgi:NADH dehydrogenase